MTRTGFTKSPLESTGFVLRDYLSEGLEEKNGVVRTRSGLRVILNGENGKFLVPQAGDSAIVEIGFRDHGIVFFEFFGIGGKTMVLSGDVNLPAFVILDRLVAATVAELELVGGSSQGVRNDLMAETNAEHGVVWD